MFWNNVLTLYSMTVAFTESVKLRTLDALVSIWLVSYVLSCLACSCASFPMCRMCSRASCVSYSSCSHSSCAPWSVCPQSLRALSVACSSASRVSCPTCSRVSRASWLIPCVLHVPVLPFRVFFSHASREFSDLSLTRQLCLEIYYS